MDMDEDDILELDRYKSWIKYEVDYVIKDAIHNISNYIKDGEITIWREMTVSDEWVKSLPTTGARLGRYWSFDKDAAEAHWGGNDKHVIKLEVTVPEKYVDWQQTITANIDPALGEDEKEITLFKNTPIKINRIVLDGELMDISNIKDKIFKA
jgi:hypothetical protein